MLICSVLGTVKSHQHFFGWPIFLAGLFIIQQLFWDAFCGNALTNLFDNALSFPSFETQPEGNFWQYYIYLLFMILLLQLRYSYIVTEYHLCDESNINHSKDWATDSLGRNNCGAYTIHWLCITLRLFWAITRVLNIIIYLTYIVSKKLYIESVSII